MRDYDSYDLYSVDYDGFTNTSTIHDELGEYIGTIDNRIPPGNYSGDELVIKETHLETLDRLNKKTDCSDGLDSYTPSYAYDDDEEGDSSGDSGLIWFIMMLLVIPAIPTWRLLHGSVSDLIIVGPFVYVFYSIITVFVYGIIVKPMIGVFKGEV